MSKHKDSILIVCILIVIVLCASFIFYCINNEFGDFRNTYKYFHNTCTEMGGEPLWVESFQDGYEATITCYFPLSYGD